MPYLGVSGRNFEKLLLYSVPSNFSYCKIMDKSKKP